MPTHTSLKGVTDFADATLSEQLETNLLYFFNWGFLGIGAFTNVTIPTSGAFGGDFHRLRLSSDGRFTTGKVWEGAKKDWVWETGIEYSRQPIRVSGVYTNGTFRPATGVGPYAHSIDYNNGRIIFNSPISTGTIVTCEYTYRNISFVTATAFSNYKKDLQFNSYRVDDRSFLLVGSGEWNQAPEQRIQLPAVIVEAEPIAKRYGAELGGLAQHVQQSVTFHVLSELNYNYKKIHDILSAQQEKKILLFDKNEAAGDGKLGLNFNGSPASGALMYPDLVKSQVYGGYGWREMTFEKVESRGGVQNESPLYYLPVRSICDVVL